MDPTKRVMSVEDYTNFFMKKLIGEAKYEEDMELHEAGLEFYTLLQSFANEGDRYPLTPLTTLTTPCLREDVRTPFKILKDVVISAWKISSEDSKKELIRRVFGILDVVHEECQSSVQFRINGTEVSCKILEELRLRLMKMVVGETWKEALPLRLEALKRMYHYWNREITHFSTKEVSKGGQLKQPVKNLTVEKLKRTVVGHSTSSWTEVFNDLLLSSGSTLAPLLLNILEENLSMEEQLKSLLG